MPITAVRGTSADRRGLRTRVLQPSQVPGMWPLIEPLIERALDASFNEIVSANIFVCLLQGTMTAFVVECEDEVQVVCVVEEMRFPQYSVAHIVVLAGSDYRSVKHFQPALEAWALAMGAVEIRGTVQSEAAVRLFRREAPDFKRGYTILRLDLRRNLQ